MPAPLRLVFLGSDPIALPLLDWLLDEGKTWVQVVAVFTRPDRPTGRGQKVAANEIKTWALAHGIAVLQPEKLTEEVRVELAALQADVSLVMAYGHILKEAFIATPRLGTLNLHASILPSYRGASPIQSAIASGDAETGVSLMRIVRRLDAGPVADSERVPIVAGDTALAIETKLAAACAPLLRRTLPLFQAQNLIFTEQDETRASYCRKLVRDDGRIDFTHPASKLVARINGLFPWPACHVQIHAQPVKIGLAEQGLDLCHEAPGTIRSSEHGALEVATGQGSVRLLKLQRPGGKMLNAADFLRGFPVEVGTRLDSEPMPQLVGAVPFPYLKH
jgi:methionyl-tRNA formyltransferase